MRLEIIAIPEMQEFFCSDMIDVKSQVELIDPIKAAGRSIVGVDVIPINECAIVAVIDGPFARSSGIADGPLTGPRHVGPTWKGIVAPVFFLLDRLEIFGGENVFFVGIGLGAQRSSQTA